MDLAAKFFEFAAMTDEQPVNLNKKVLLIDGLNAYIRAFAATPTLTDDGNHAGGVTGFLLSIGAVIRQFQPSRVIICFDGEGGSHRRRQLFPDYKAKRKVMMKLNRTYDFASLEEEKESREKQLKTLVTLLQYLPVTVVAPDLVEADDTIAYLAQHIEENGGSSIIVSSDKDFLQLVNESISVYSPIKKKHYHADGIVTDYGFHPNNFLLYRTVTGDNSDCIPGVEGIKEKTLLKYFPELAEAQKRDLNFLFEKASQIQKEKGKKTPIAITSLLQSKEILERNNILMRLDDVAMSVSTRIKVLDAYDKNHPQMSKFEFQKFIGQLGMMEAFKQFDTWFITTWASLNRNNK